jgi:hypothetical protein
VPGMRKTLAVAVAATMLACGGAEDSGVTCLGAEVTEPATGATVCLWGCGATATLYPEAGGWRAVIQPSEACGATCAADSAAVRCSSVEREN